MKRLILALVLAASLPAFAQTSTNTVSTDSTSAASNQGVALINNSYAPAVTTSQGSTDFHTNQAQAVPPSFSSQASIQTCSAAGAGLALQVPGGGISGAMGGGVDAGCDLKRDLDIMAFLGVGKGEMVARACLKKELAQVMAACKATDPAPVSTVRPNPWQAGG